MIGFGVFLAVLGAILKYALDLNVEGFNMDTAGGILLVVGIGLALFGLILFAMDYFRDDDVLLHDDPVAHEDHVDRLPRRRRFRRF